MWNARAPSRASRQNQAWAGVEVEAGRMGPTIRPGGRAFHPGCLARRNCLMIPTTSRCLDAARMQHHSPLDDRTKREHNHLPGSQSGLWNIAVDKSGEKL